MNLLMRSKTVLLGFAATVALATTSAQAAVYGGGGLGAGVGAAAGIGGMTSGSIRQVILKIVSTALSYVALLAVIMVIIAGIRLVASQGEEEQKEKARKTVLYVVIGLIVILLAKGIVTLALSFTH